MSTAPRAVSTDPPADNGGGLVPNGLIRRYRALLQIEGAGRAAAAAFVGRLPIGMISLSILLLVRQQSGSFGRAGAVVAAFALAMAVGQPVLGRLVDRVGARAVVGWLGTADALALLALVATVRADLPLAVTLTASAAAGIVLPPLSAAVRTMWARLSGPELSSAAYSLDSVGTEVVFLLGPLLVGLLVAVASPALGLVLAAVLTVTGSWGFALAPATRGAVPVSGRRRLVGALASSGLRRLLGVATLQVLAFALVEVGVPAAATRAGSAALSGPLLALWSVGSIAGGLVFGGLRLRAPIRRQYVFLSWLVVVGIVPVLPVSGPLALGLLLPLSGLAIAPLFALAARLVSEATTPATRTEGYTWLTTSAAMGAAGGSALGGFLVDRSGVAACFLAAAGMAALAALLATALSGGSGQGRYATSDTAV